MAVPGVVAGIFDIHRDLGRMPIADILAPAIDLARSGVEVDSFHHYITGILESILNATPGAFSLYESPGTPGQLIRESEIQCNPDAATTLGILAADGPDPFYRGEWAAILANDCRAHGGQLTLQDMESYRVERREPVRFSYRGAQCAINAPPSPGGCLIAFTLRLLSSWLNKNEEWGSEQHLLTLIRGMRAASLARTEYSMETHLDRNVMSELLDENTLSRWQEGLKLHSMFSRGTTHISVADCEGNLASLTASNGEGCAYVLPGTGVMLNNMLGEEDLNPGGFHQWREGSRLASMMSPAVAERSDGTRIALGTGGSNRIRSAITQVLSNILDFDMPLSEAVAAPRIHLEHGKLSVENGFAEPVIQALESVVPEIHHWPEKNLFFGGVHTASVTPSGSFSGAGDPRRGGVVAYANS
jgi:gamma-glutamyltranspeptidase/glutathione hydrolase